jgi:hypothetical protein
MTRFSVIFLALLKCAAAQTSSHPLAGPSDVCTLLTTREVGDAAGVPVREGVSRLSNGNLRSCWFGGERPGVVAILVRRLPTADWASEEVGRMSRGVQVGTYRRVAGIGDHAFLYSLHNAGGVLCVFGNDYYLQISLYRRGEDSRIPDALETLAKSALARLMGGRNPLTNGTAKTQVPDARFADAQLGRFAR